MAVLYIAEYAEAVIVQGSLLPVPTEPPLAEQTVAIGGTSTQSSALNAKTRFIRLHTDAICSILVGVNPTATTGKQRMAAGQTEFKRVDKLTTAAGTTKVAVISNT
jgi:hypothetical protein